MKKLLFLLFVFLFGSQITSAQTAVDLSTITSSNNISTNYDLDLTNGFTLEGWFKFNQLGIYQGVFGKTNGGLPQPLDTYLVDSTNEITVFLGNGGSFQNFNTGLIISDNNWHHIAFTYNVTTNVINSYLDGVSGTSFTYTGPALSNTATPLLIGNRADGGTNANVLVDDVRLWNSPRSAGDIALAAANNVCFTDSESNLEVFYTMSEGTGTTLTDLALANGAQNGTINTGGWATEGITPNITTPAPTGLATQVYTGDDKTLANLAVTGTTIKWYDAATNGNLLPNTTVLVDETTYYASNTEACGESTTRLVVTVNRISENSQDFSTCATVADLVSTPSTGTTAAWFTASSGGTAMLSTDVLSSGTYYVEQTTAESIETLGTGFNLTHGVAVQADGKILIADYLNNAIKRMNADGTSVVTLGSGFSFPKGVTVQADGKILITDSGNDVIKRMNADGTGIVTLGSAFTSSSAVAVQADGKILIAANNNHAIKRMNADGTGIVTLGSGFNFPRGIVVQSDGKILIADYGNQAIKRMNADGTSVETLGMGFIPEGVAVQSDGKILIADYGNQAIKRMNADGTSVETLVGTGLSYPNTVTVQADGKILISDSNNNAIKRLSEVSVSNRVAVTVTVTAPAPTGLATQVYTGDDKTLANLTVTGTTIKWYDAATNGNLLPNTTALADETTYYASNTEVCGESAIRLGVTVNRISDNTQTLASCAKTVADLVSTPSTGTSAAWFTASSGGTAMLGTDVLTSGTYYVEQTTAPNIETLGNGFISPAGVAVQADGKILIPNIGLNEIHRMNADGSGIVTLGSGFSTPYAAVEQVDGKILVADFGNSLIKRMDADGNNIVTLGSGFSFPKGIAVQADGKILIADTTNGAIKRMDADGSNIVTLGSGFSFPNGVAIQADGKILIAEEFGTVIKRMDADGSNIVTLGSGFNRAKKLAVQADGRILIADTNNSAIKRMDADGNNNQTLVTGLNYPYGVAVQSDGRILIADTNNNAIKRLTTESVSNRVPVTVTVTPVNEASFNYSAASYCSNDVDPTPTITGLGGGTFSSSPAGLSINSGTGAIDVSASTPNIYTVTYTTAGACPNTSNVNVTISTIADQTVAASSTTICSGDSTTIDLGSSEIGVRYFLRDADDDSIIAGPITGTGGSISFNTGNITETTTYNVYAETLDGALDFDGSNDYVNTNIDISHTVYPKFTFEAWVYPTRVGYGSRQAIFSHDNCCYDRGVIIETGTSSWGVAVGGALWLAGSVDVNQWQHIAVVYDEVSKTAKFYKNGVESVYSGGPTNFSTSSNPMWLGRNPGYNEPFQGAMDDVRVWNTVRDLSDISTEMNNCLVGNEAGLSAYYKLDDGSGSSVAIDATGGGNNGILINMDSSTDWILGIQSCSSCDLEMTQMSTVTVTPLDDASFSYSAAVYVVDDADPTPSITGLVGGTFSSTPGGLSLNASTGLIDVSASTINTYTVTYTTAGACPNSSDVPVQIIDNNADLNITGSCSDATVLGGYNIDGTHNGKPKYVKIIQASSSTACNDIHSESACDAAIDGITASIRWNGAAWEWVKEATTLNCQWFAPGSMCIPGFRLSETKITARLATETLATNPQNTADVPCTGWVAGGGGCLPVFDCSVLSTNDAEVLNQLATIYPNPNNGNFTLSYLGQEKLTQLTIFDVIGKKVKTILLNNFNQSKEISLTALAKGMYFMTIESETANTTKRVIIR